ncbi:MAG: hypothetical protein FJW30_19340 [Acidobacteria bacterium]|nr:hypothetical protein [Acidobacteriota bacterium]
MPSAEVLPDVPALLVTAPDAERLRLIHQAGEDELQEDCARWAKGVWETAALASCWREGWTRVERRDWTKVFSIYFFEELKHTQPVSNIFVATMLAKIDTKIDAVPARVVDELERRGMGASKLRLLPPEPMRFTGRGPQLAWLRLKLAPGRRALLYGEPGTGKSTIAEHAAWMFADSFENVVFQACGDRPVAVIADELLRRLGVDTSTLAPDAKAGAVRARLAGRSLLLILDDVWHEDSAQLLIGSPAAILLTSRRNGALETAAVDSQAVGGFTPEEAEAFLRESIDARFHSRMDDLLRFADEMERHPYAMAAFAGLLRKNQQPVADALASVRRRALRDGRFDLPALLDAAVAARSDQARVLLRAVAVCAKEGVWLEFAAAVAGMTADTAVEELVGVSLLRVNDREAQVFSLHALLHARLRETNSDSLRRRHAEVFSDWLSRWEEEWRRCVRVVGEAEEVLGYWDVVDYARSFGGTAGLVFSLGLRTGLLGAAHAAMVAAEMRYGRLGNRAGLAVSWGNQALIMRAWGKLDGAMELHKKEEALCEQLGDRAGLQRSWGNQALILQTWGKMDDGMALHKKEEAMCEELGDRAGLQSCWGNQAVILKAWGKLDEAMALHKIEEAVCEELGDRAGLGRSLTNQASIHHLRGEVEWRRTKLKHARNLFAAVGMAQELELVTRALAECVEFDPGQGDRYLSR